LIGVDCLTLQTAIWSRGAIRRRQLPRQRTHHGGPLDADYAAIYRDHPFYRSPDFVGAVKKLLQQRTVRSILDGE
jgi:hypothetical protein